MPRPANPCTDPKVERKYGHQPRRKGSVPGAAPECGRDAEREEQARQHDEQQDRGCEEMDPARRALAALPVLEAHCSEVISVGDGNARQGAGWTVHDGDERPDLARVEKSALPPRLVVQCNAAQVQAGDQADANRARTDMEQPHRARRQQWARRLGPFGDEAPERLGERRIERRRAGDQALDPPQGQLRQHRCAAGLPAAERARPMHHDQHIDDQIPQHQSQERERQDVDAPAAIQRGECAPQGQREPYQQPPRPRRTARQPQQGVHEWVAHDELAAQQLGAPYQEALSCPAHAHASDPAIRDRVPAGSAGCFARRRGAVRRRDEYACTVGFLDRLDQQDGGQSVFLHR